MVDVSRQDLGWKTGETRGWLTLLCAFMFTIVCEVKTSCGMVCQPIAVNRCGRHLRHGKERLGDIPI